MVMIAVLELHVILDRGFCVDNLASVIDLLGRY